MPTESSTLPAVHPSTSPSTSFLSSSQLIKCSICGLGTPESTFGSRTRDEHGVVLLVSPPERICGRCVRSSGRTDSLDDFEQAMEGMNVADIIIEEARETDENDDLSELAHSPVDDTHLASFTSSLERRSRPFPLRIPSGRRAISPSTTTKTFSQSLPANHIRDWNTSTPVATPIPESPEGGNLWSPEDDSREPPNPLLDVTNQRVSRAGRGALFAGSIFRGTQTSGRSSYEVEVKFLDVNLEESTLSGYLSISHLTDAHPHLTTFFEGEIIGPKFGFLTGSRYGATEHDDMRHWGRFEQFRRPSTRADIVRPEMVFRDPLPDWSRGETQAKERDFVFLRLKERFLVPDHTVRDISGASFAGFYFAMVDLSPTAGADEPPLSPSSPTTTKATLPLSPTSPTTLRRMSSSGDRIHMPRRRSSSAKVKEEVSPVRGEATIRGYYFHSLNQEPFQELFLSHVPSKSDSAFEMR